MCIPPTLPTGTSKPRGKRAWYVVLLKGRIEKEGKKIVLPEKSD